MTRGGKREGAGRKPARGVRKVIASIRVTPETKHYLDAQESAGETVENAIQRSKSFRDWRKAKDEDS